MSRDSLGAVHQPAGLAASSLRRGPRPSARRRCARLLSAPDAAPPINNVARQARRSPRQGDLHFAARRSPRPRGRPSSVRCHRGHGGADIGESVADEPRRRRPEAGRAQIHQARWRSVVAVVAAANLGSRGAALLLPFRSQSRSETRSKSRRRLAKNKSRCHCRRQRQRRLSLASAPLCERLESPRSRAQNQYSASFRPTRLPSPLVAALSSVGPASRRL